VRVRHAGQRDRRRRQGQQHLRVGVRQGTSRAVEWGSAVEGLSKAGGRGGLRIATCLAHGVRAQEGERAVP
jgi:hypothetical protein